MDRAVYDERFFNAGDETLGFAFIPALIGASPGIFSAIAGLFGGRRSEQFRGLREINNGGQQLMQALQQLLAAVSAGQIDPAYAVSEASRLASMLSDPAIFYQAQRGDDAAALRNFKAQAAQLVQQIQAAAASRTAAVTSAAAASAGGAAGVSSSVLLIGLLALTGVVLFTSNRGAYD